MMRLIFLVMLPLAWSYGPNSQGGGAFAYVDSAGHRYGGTYGLQDGKVVSPSGDPWPAVVPFADTAYPGDDFGPAYFANLENLLQEVFKNSIQNQKLAFNAAEKAFDLTSNQAAGYYPSIPSRFPAFGGFPFGGYGMPRPVPNYGNSAYASASAGPGYQHQVASIYPANPSNPNVDQIKHYSDTLAPSGSNFYSVASKSYSSSSNVNGKETSNRGAETVVNDNGRVTRYKVQS